MHENVSEFEVSMHHLIHLQSFKGIDYLSEYLNSLFLRQGLILFEVLRKISLIAVLENQIEVVGCLFDIVEFDYVGVVACLQDSYFVVEQVQEFAYLG